jgi:PncC family amidohydrolase
VVGRVLINRGLTISVAESCTGGGIGELLTRYAGSSSYFLGGVIAYSNHIKKDVLGVSPTLLLNDGAVSSAVVEAMADGVRLLTQSSIAVSISGIAGPDGGGPKKPVGTFFVGLATDSGTKSYEFFFSSDRERIRSFAAYKALEVVRRELLNLPIPEDVRPS